MSSPVWQGAGLRKDPPAVRTPLLAQKCYYVMPLPLPLSVLQTMPAFPLRCVPCRHEVVHEGPGLKDELSSFFSHASGRNHARLTVWEFTFLTLTPGYTGIMAPDSGSHMLMNHGIFQPLLPRSPSSSLLRKGKRPGLGVGRLEFQLGLDLLYFE